MNKRTAPSLPPSKTEQVIQIALGIVFLSGMVACATSMAYLLFFVK